MTVAIGKCHQWVMKVEAPSLEAFQARLDRALCRLIQLKMLKKRL